MVSNIVEEHQEKFKISIVIPVYNRETYLLRTLDSVVNQTYRPLQLILVDNTSTDDSLNICYEFQQKYRSDNFNIIVEAEDRQGASYARNKGLECCDSEYVYFFDSDDYMSSDFISTVLEEVIKKNLDVLAVKTKMQIGMHKERVRDFSYSESPIKQILMSMLSTVSAVYRTSFIKSIGGWNVDLLTWDDWELGTRVLLASPRMEWYKAKAFHQIYVHNESITGSSFSGSYLWLIKALKAVRQDIELQIFDEKKKHKLLLALYYRQIILAATLYKEGNEMQSKECRFNAKEILRISKFEQIVSDFLFFYTSHGGRGAWRIALYCL